MPDTETEKFKHFSHSPIEFEWNGVKAKVNETGKIEITQEQQDGTYDQIDTSADFIFRLASILSATKKVRFSDKPYQRRQGQG